MSYLNDEMKFLIKWQITPEEFFAAKLIFLASEDEDKYLSMFYSQGKYDHGIRESLQSLKEKNLIKSDIPSQDKVLDPKDIFFDMHFGYGLYKLVFRQLHMKLPE